MRQTCDEALANRVSNIRKYNRNIARFTLECDQSWCRSRHKQVRLQTDQLCSAGLQKVWIWTGPAVLELDILIIYPARLLQRLTECFCPLVRSGVALDVRHQHADAHDAAGLLRTRRERPCCCTANQRDEIAPAHTTSRLRMTPVFKVYQIRVAMSALGQKQTYAKRDVRFTPESGHVQCTRQCLLWANSGLMQRSNLNRYSINSLASDWNDAGTVNPSFLAVVRLMTNSNLLSRSIGSSLGLAPLRM